MCAKALSAHRDQNERGKKGPEQSVKITVSVDFQHDGDDVENADRTDTGDDNVVIASFVGSHSVE